MRRREFITLLGGAAAWPLAARAQQRERMRRIGVLVGTLPAGDPEWQARSNAFVQGLQERGWSDGRNLRIDYRWGLLRKYVAELVALAPDVILAAGARHATNALLVERRSRSRLMSIRPSCRNFRRYASTAQHRCTGPS
jgi:putative ABC transport system substrate-binding protein